MKIGPCLDQVIDNTFYLSLIHLYFYDIILDSIARRKCSQLVIMSDFNTVVDQWGEGQTGLDRVRTMVFSPDGTKLGKYQIKIIMFFFNAIQIHSREHTE